MLYLITYDLNKTDKNYDNLYAAIKNCGDWCRDPGLDSVWFVSTTSSASQLSNYLKQYIDTNDRLFITRVYSGENDGWLAQDVWNWINTHL